MISFPWSKRSLASCALLGVMWVGGCDRSSSTPPAADSAANSAAAPAASTQPAAGDHDAEHALHHLIRISEKLYSGGEPAGESAFAELKALGIRTIVSVDGKQPDVELARQHGLRYVHIPFGYDGIPRSSALALTRAARECEKPMFVHCHHGLHRGPAGAAIIAMAEGLMNPEQARAYLERAGTSPSYAGLWRDVAGYTAPQSNESLPNLVEVAPVESLAAAMAKLDRAWDRLKLAQKAQWQTPTDHPDLVPAQEALLVEECFRESLRTLEPREYDERFRTLLAESEKQAAALRTALEGSDADAKGAAFKLLGASCKSCHEAYRN